MKFARSQSSLGNRGNDERERQGIAVVIESKENRNGDPSKVSPRQKILEMLGAPGWMTFETRHGP